VPLIAIVRAGYSAYDSSCPLLWMRVRVKDRERREELRELKEAHQNTLKAKNDENVRSRRRRGALRCNRAASALPPWHDASQRIGERVDLARPLVIGIRSLILDAQSVRWKRKRHGPANCCTRRLPSACSRGVAGGAAVPGGLRCAGASDGAAQSERGARSGPSEATPVKPPPLPQRPRRFSALARRAPPIPRTVLAAPSTRRAGRTG
jgi:hypothetical protein